MSIKTIHEVEGIKPLAKYSLAKIVDSSVKMVYLKGMVPFNEVNFKKRKMKLFLRILLINQFKYYKFILFNQCMNNAEKVLKSCNSSLKNAIKVNLYLTVNI